jgi:hypothetical protein
MLIGSVVGDDIRDDLDAVSVGFLDERLRFREGDG